jgi:hypothetical protein
VTVSFSLFEPLCHLTRSKIISSPIDKSPVIMCYPSQPNAQDERVTCVTGNATVSGLNDMDYSSVNGLVSGMSDIKHVTTTNKVPLPPEVMEHFGRILFFWRYYLLQLLLAPLFSLYMGFSSRECRRTHHSSSRWPPMFCCGSPGSIPV